MEIIEIKDKKQWENFVLSQLYTIFVQSSHYGDFYEAMGEKSWIFGVYDNNKFIGGSLVVSTYARRGRFLYLPYGPIFSETPLSFIRRGDGGEVVHLLVTHLRHFARQNSYDFIRVSPFWENTQETKKIFKRLGFINAPMHILAENTWLLDLTKSEEELLAEMEKGHRYLIRRCEKDGVKITKSNNLDDLKLFNQLHDETAKRHKFHRFPKEYVEKEFASFAQHNQSLIFNAYLPDGRLDSSAIIMFYGNMSAYRHGASLGLDNKLPTSYLLQWEAIKEAKRRGMKWHNFWGITPEKAGKKHPFYGITHFKKGFGGEQLNLIHCQDLPITKKYWVNWIIETIRSIKRGFK